MLVGIKYCGGCRASFDRIAEAERVIEAVSGSGGADIQSPVFIHAEEGERYDVLLVVCGCRTRCPDIGAYSAESIVYIDSAGEDGVIEGLRRIFRKEVKD